MAAPTDTFIDPADGVAAGNDHGGAAFVDGSFANATNTLTKVGAFTAATIKAGNKIWLDDNGSGQVADGLYTINARVDDDNVTLTADIRSGAPDPVDVRCDQHNGTINLTWATAQHALDFTTRDAVDGDRFNVKAGTDDVLAAALDFLTYGTPTDTAMWICQGYTTAAGDGGIGGISGNGGNFSIVGGDALDYLMFIDMHLHNTGTADVISIDNYNSFIGCEIDDSTALGLDLDFECVVMNCHVHDCDGITVRRSGTVAFCTVESLVTGISLGGDGGVALFNVVIVGVGSRGIVVSNDANVIMFNSIYDVAGAFDGILVPGNCQGTVVVSNIVEGFSGVGGVGINLAAGSNITLYGFNAFYNNTTNLDSTGDIHIDFSANDQILTASPFVDAANDDFTVKASVRALAYPTANYPSLAVRSYLDIGALQRAERPGPTLRGRNTLLRM